MTGRTPHSYRLRRADELWPPPGWTWDGLDQHREQTERVLALLQLHGAGVDSERGRDWAERMPIQQAVGRRG